tara:strand:+ start:198 stop:1286 length:1089 start_codon:yes stop_codon:yes gene_type:complete
MAGENNITVLVTGGSGFIGTSLIIKLLQMRKFNIINLDKLNYSSDNTGINEYLASSSSENSSNYQFINLDLCNKEKINSIILKLKPDIVFHLAAETHVDRSIENPRLFLENNVIGTFNLLEASFQYWESLNFSKKQSFKYIHISTDEVFGTLGSEGSFNELSNYSPNSPYSASKASSDHFVRAFHHTYNFPINIVNCSNNFGQWQFPEKFIPLIINKAISGQKIPIYGDGLNVRDWLYVEDHVDALILIMKKGLIGSSYCIGGIGECTNLRLVEMICQILDEIEPKDFPHNKLISFVKDRPGHDFRYSIDPYKIRNELGWLPKYDFQSALRKTIKWYLKNKAWTKYILSSSGYDGSRLGLSK